MLYSLHCFLRELWMPWILNTQLLVFICLKCLWLISDLFYGLSWYWWGKQRWWINCMFVSMFLGVRCGCTTMPVNYYKNVTGILSASETAIIFCYNLKLSSQLSFVLCLKIDINEWNCSNLNKQSYDQWYSRRDPLVFLRVSWTISSNAHFLGRKWNANFRERPYCHV